MRHSFFAVNNSPLSGHFLPLGKIVFTTLFFPCMIATVRSGNEDKSGI